MGGVGSGGARPGSGRKPKPKVTAWLGGNAGKRARKAPARPEAHDAAFPLLPAPRDLPAAHVAVWNELAPHACAARTLTAGTAHAFRDLCARVVLLRAMAAQVDADGLMTTAVSLQMDESGGGLQTVEKKAHDLLGRYMTMMQRVDASLLRFRLSPMGKELAAPETPKDEWAEFDDGPVVN